ncbi:MAG: response regulator [Bdellovibrionaceae bacterium]|nr:response regulator [Pseudobdellovibrionaceae bacterium]
MFDLNIRVLIVDDSATTRKITRKYLTDLGFTKIDEAGDGALGWSKIIGSHPPYSLVICDWHMPRISGLELLKNVRTTNDTKSLSFVMVTGEQNKEEVLKALKMGASGYIVKPFEPDILKKTLEKLPAIMIAESDISQLKLEEARQKKAAEAAEAAKMKLAEEAMRKTVEEMKKKSGA